MLNVDMLSVIALNVVILTADLFGVLTLSVNMLNVGVPAHAMKTFSIVIDERIS